MTIQISLKQIYLHPLVGGAFHTLVYCLQNELKGCRTVLDLGCGRDSPLQYCSVRQSLGVDVFPQSVEESRRKKIHDRYLIKDIRYLGWKPRSFDTVILIDVLEHLPKEEGHNLLKKVEQWAKKKVIVTTPNGLIHQGLTEGNPFQQHLSGWKIEELRRRGYRARGLAGWRGFRTDRVLPGIKDSGSLFASIRFRPRKFWFIMAAISQIATYFLPSLSFEVMYVKQIES